MTAAEQIDLLNSNLIPEPAAAAPIPPESALELVAESLPTAEKARRLLDLCQTDGAKAELIFNALPGETQKELVLSVSPDKRLQLLELPEDATALVQSLPPLELHRTVAVNGKWECQEVVEVASEDQINFMLDHDCWRGEHLDSRKFTDWLQLFMECDDSQIFRILTSINADLLALALKKHVQFDQDMMIEDTYYLDPDWVKGSNPVVQQFLERLYALEPNLWIRLLAWVRTHSKPTIEADAIEAREGRLRGSGFPSPTIALTVYYPVEFDVKALVDGWQRDFLAAGTQGTAALTALNREPLFLEQVVTALKSGPDADPFIGLRLEADLADVANKVMIADQVDFGDLRRQREAIDKIKRWISIGLELSAASQLDRGAELLKQQRPEYFFRLSAMLFDTLANAVVEVEKREQRSGGLLVGGEYAHAYFTLIEPEPQLPAGSELGSGHPITTLKEYRHAWQWVWLLEQRLGMLAPVPDPAAG